MARLNPAVSDRESFRYSSSSASCTFELGVKLGELAVAGDLFLLEGELGAGKTCFVQGLGRGLGITEPIRSPTFILANEHRGGRLALFHIDVYRARNADEAIGFGLEDYIGGDGVCAIEWAEKIVEALPGERLVIQFSHSGESSRELMMEASGDRYRFLLGEWIQSLQRGVDAPGR